VDPFLREEEEGRKLQNKFPPPFLREKEKTEREYYPSQILFKEKTHNA